MESFGVVPDLENVETLNWVLEFEVQSAQDSKDLAELFLLFHVLRAHSIFMVNSLEDIFDLLEAKVS